jgi:hypothetical protein
LDQAFEQSYREIQQFVFPAQARELPSDVNRDDPGRGVERDLEWDRPLVPAFGFPIEDQAGFYRHSRSVVVDDMVTALATDRVRDAQAAQPSMSVASPVPEGAPVRSELASLVTTSNIPLVSLLSAAAALAGWLWSRSVRKGRIRLRALGVKL